MFNRINTLKDQLAPIARQNAQFMRTQAAQVADKVAGLPDCRRKRRDEQYVNQIERQAVKWENLIIPGPQSRTR
jgi:hypothetical protein